MFPNFWFFGALVVLLKTRLLHYLVFLGLRKEIPIRDEERKARTVSCDRKNPWEKVKR